jgi:hypothetical protein
MIFASAKEQLADDKFMVHVKADARKPETVEL